MALFFKEEINNLNDYNIENEFLEIIRQYYFEGDHNIELELKKFNSNDHMRFFFLNFRAIPPEKLRKIIQVFIDRKDKFLDIIKKTMVELVSFLGLVTKIIDFSIRFKYLTEEPLEEEFEAKTEAERSLRELAHILVEFQHVVLEICSHVSEFDMVKCDNVFLNFGLTVLLDFLKIHPEKRTLTVQIIVKLIKNDVFSADVLVNKIARIYRKEEVLLYHLTLDLVTHHFQQLIGDELLDYFKKLVFRGLHSSNDIVAVKSLKILSNMIMYNCPIVTELNNSVGELALSWNWEVRASVLVFSFNILAFLNGLKVDVTHLKEEMTQLEGQEEFKEQLAEKEEELNIAENNIQIISEFEDYYLQLIEGIFDFHSPLLTLKVGFIYLARILEFYPSLAKKYMKMLIEFDQSNIRNEVLTVGNEEEENKYTGNWYSEPYLTTGAPNSWNSIVILENVAEFDLIHLNILSSIVVKVEFREEEKAEWISIFKDLRKYIYFALCNEEFTGFALSILKKFFSFPLFVDELLDLTKDSFLLAMTSIYDRTMEECEKNMKDLLTFISEEGGKKAYIYQLLKEFAIANNEIYLRSNLLDLLNDIYKGERGKIFHDEDESEDE